MSIFSILLQVVSGRQSSTNVFVFIYVLIEVSFFFFFFQAEDGIRDLIVTGVQTCALPIYLGLHGNRARCSGAQDRGEAVKISRLLSGFAAAALISSVLFAGKIHAESEIGRASCRERV